ncbi:MAG: ATP-binding protein [Bacteroidetes bacterium]|nr:ATP-binding protein [Bacteroidota bacterium]
MYIQRQITSQIVDDFFKGKIIIILGARQVGKTTLLKSIVSKRTEPVLWLDGENADVQLLFQNMNSEKARHIAGNHKVLIIDEAQKIQSIGTVLKMYSDYHSDIQVVASGSSAFELRNVLNEPLTGRKFEYHLFPLSFEEMVQATDLLQEQRQLHQRLRYGYYPEIVTKTEDNERLLRFLAESYLYKDIFLFKGIKKPEKMLDLLKLLAWQLGSEVNYHELSQILKIDNQTIESYIAMLEQAFVVYKLAAYHTNHRNELKKSKKIYFNDLGIRNALINDFRPVELRSDAGGLFENHMINEIRKQNIYQRYYANIHFWRNTEQREIDLILEKDNHLHLYEFKWNPLKTPRLPISFSNNYSNFTYTVVNQDNFNSFLSTFSLKET